MEAKELFAMFAMPPFSMNRPGIAGLAVTAAAVAGSTIVRKPFGMRREKALLLGLLGLTVAAGLSSSRSMHVAAGVLFTGMVGYHVYKHRKAL